MLVATMVPGCGSPLPDSEAPRPSVTPEVAELAPTSRQGLINPAHLDFLTEPIVSDGEPMALVHIYSEYPDYRWVDASGEGLAAVDDVARAALVYLEVYERYADEAALERARLLLNFVMRMQDDDGQYYNFVLDRAGTINTSGQTSFKDWGWWAARGQWALARGVAVFGDLDEPYADRLRERYLRGESALDAALDNVGEYTELHGQRIPAWLLKGGSDVTSLALLGLAEYYAVEPNATTRRLAFALGQAVAEYQLGDSDEYPFGLRPSTATSTAFWHAWGAHPVQALARAGAVFERDDWVVAAAAEAELWFGRLLTTGMIREVGVVPRRYDQIAYGQSMVVLGLWNLFRATEDDRYRQMSGLAAAWFFGDNPAGVDMYDPDTGRGFDGLAGANEFRVNRNAGAESTIEALLALLAVAEDPVASTYLDATPERVLLPLVVQAEKAKLRTGDPGYGLQDWDGEAYYSGGRFYELRQGDSLEVAFRVAEPASYDVYVAHRRQAAGQRDLDVEASRAAHSVTIDADLTEWSGTQPLKADQPQNVLRGASAWPGAEGASYTASFLWDADNLYAAVEVRDPEHVQTGVGPDVWRGDAVWIYLDTAGQGSRIDAKLTLAQTPAGPQVWNWVGGAFQAGVQLAWREVPGGYVYEASVPWHSLNRPAPAAGDRLGFEVGYGFGTGFMDWTGTDPDTPGNLAPLTLVEALTADQQEPTAELRDPESVAIRVQLDGGEPALLPELISPDRDYLWLDRVLEAVELAPGEHRIAFSYAGSSPDRAATVDAFWLHPVVASKTWRLADGTSLRLEYDTRTGELSWHEE